MFTRFIVILLPVIHAIYCYGPRFSSSSSHVNTFRGSNAKLDCEAYGSKPMTNTWLREVPSSSGSQLNPIPLSENYPSYPRPPYSWSPSHHSSSLPLRHTSFEKDFESANNKTIFELHIHSVEPDDSGVYVCKAVNEFGEATKRITLTIQDVPSSPEQLRVDQIWTRSVSFRWSSPASNGNSQLLRYIIQYWRDNKTSPTVHRLHEEVTSSTSLSYQITDKLLPGTSYALRVIAENTLGRGVPSKTIEFTTKDEEPDASPVDIHVESRGTTALRVSWKSPPRNHWNGRLKGYLLGYREINEDELSSSSLSRLGSSPPDLSQYNMKDIRFLGQPNDNYQQEFSLNDLKRGASYAIIIRAYNEAGPGPFSQPIIVSTSTNDPPKAPTIRVSERKETSLVVKWDQTGNSDDITHYNLFYKDDRSPWLQIAFPASKTSEYELTNLKRSTWYELYMKSEGLKGSSEPSQVIMVKTLGDSNDYVIKAANSERSNHERNDRPVPIYLNSFIVIPISGAIIVVVIVCAVAYAYINLEEKKAALLKAGYMSQSPSKNFQYISTASTPNASQSIVSEESSLTLRYSDSSDRSKPLLARPPVPAVLWAQQQGPILEEETDDYNSPYESLPYNKAKRISTFGGSPPPPPRNPPPPHPPTTLMSTSMRTFTPQASTSTASAAGAISPHRQPSTLSTSPSHPMPSTSSHSPNQQQSTSSNVFCKADIHCDDGSTRAYDFFSFHQV